ncbi:MAG: Zn-ribbon domain-containing OB-fold protein [Promethearchaeota archaeon]
MSEHEMGFVVELSSDVKNKQRMTAEFRKFIAGLEEGKLLSTKCKSCGKKFMPPRFTCPCGGEDLEWFEEKPEGTLYTWSIVHFAPDGIAKQVNVPYPLGVIEFEDGLKLAAHLKGLTSKPKVGMKVKVVPQELDNGNLAYFIKPA